MTVIPSRSSLRALLIGSVVGLVPASVLRQVGRPMGRFGLGEVDLLASLAALLHLDGPMVDVGARWGTASVPFAKRGRRVLQFEPDPRNHPVLASVRRFRRGISTDFRAASDEAQESMTLYSSPGHTAISSLMPFDESHRAGVSVQVVTLDEALAEHGLESVSVLKTDTEGHDLRTLRGLDLSGRYRPGLIMSEFDQGKVASGGHTFAELSGALVSAGYRVLASEWFPIAAYGASHRWRRITEVPCALADPMGHGNVIAIDEAHPKEPVDRAISAWADAMARAASRK